MKNHISEFTALMRSNRLNEIVIKTFSSYYEKVLAGATGIISENDINPPREQNLVNYHDLSDESNDILDKLVVIKLNGGLGTSMGLSKVKSLLKVKDKITFLDIIALQIMQLRKVSGKETPLMFMNSFNTKDDTLNFLAKYNKLQVNDLPLDFIQNKFPKIKQEDLSPLNEKSDNLNWNPPGHGEIYTVLQISGILDTLLDKGYEYIFISNSDNLGAVVDNKILNYLSKFNIPFIMEVCERTEMDKKGGHLAETLGGQLLLREVAQCPENEISSFQDIKKYKYFNTNNLWVNIKMLKQKIEEVEYILSLPLILNKKEVAGTKVFQIESAMGAAISSFTNSKAIIIDRSRFIPVKKTNDLLCIWSDVYDLSPEYHLTLNKDLERPPNIVLDDNYYKTIDQLQERILEVPSLKKCKELIVEGDVYFGKNVVIEKKVEIKSREKLILTDRTFS